MKKTYKLPVTLTRFTNFDIDFDKLIDSINKYNHDSKPDLVKTEVTYEILSNYFVDISQAFIAIHGMRAARIIAEKDLLI